MRDCRAGKRVREASVFLSNLPPEGGERQNLHFISLPPPPPPPPPPPFPFFFPFPSSLFPLARKKIAVARKPTAQKHLAIAILRMSAWAPLLRGSPCTSKSGCDCELEALNSAMNTLATAIASIHMIELIASQVSLQSMFAMHRWTNVSAI